MAEILTSLDDGVLTVRMSRAAKRNALSLPFARELVTAFEAAEGAGAIALLADGDHFCVGGDVGAMAAADDPAEFVGELAETFHGMIRAMRSGVPVIAGVRGWAAGAGMSIVLQSDLAVAGESAQFQPAYAGIGVTPDGGMTWALPRAVGPRRAAAIVLENRVLSATDANSLGIVDRVVPDGDVESTVLSIARTIAAGPRSAFHAAKRLLVASETADLASQLDAEAASIAACAAGPEGQEGIRAFTERRRPDFGRTR